jgi:hypothetical protein
MSPVKLTETREFWRPLQGFVECGCLPFALIRYRTKSLLVWFRVDTAIIIAHPPRELTFYLLN